MSGSIKNPQTISNANERIRQMEQLNNENERSGRGIKGAVERKEATRLALSIIAFGKRNGLSLSLSLSRLKLAASTLTTSGDDHTSVTRASSRTR
jgi:hypothetical protein